MYITKIIISSVIFCFLSGCAGAGIGPDAWTKNNYCTSNAAYSQGKRDAMTEGGKFNRQYAYFCLTNNTELNVMYAQGYYEGLPLNPGGPQAAEPYPDFEKERHDEQVRRGAFFILNLVSMLSA